MSIDNNGFQAAHPGEDEKQPDTGEGHGSGLEQASSEPKQDNVSPADWTPPPGNPGSDQDAQVDRDNGTASTKDTVEKASGFGPGSTDVSDQQVDPLHPAKTSNVPVSREAVPGEESAGHVPTQHSR